MFSHKCFKVTILFLLISISTCINQPQKDTNKRLRKDIRKIQLPDLPTKNDIYKYLKVLQGIVYFYKYSKDKIDPNLAYGLLILNVNLQMALQHKISSLPMYLMVKIKQIVDENGRLLRYFHKTVNRVSEDDSLTKQLSSLMLNSTKWIEGIKKFNSIKIKTVHGRRSLLDLERHNNTWEHYLSVVNDVSAGRPNIKESDQCISSLAQSKVQTPKFYPVCEVFDNCYYTLVKGTDSGYALTHRLLLLLVAWYGRGCFIISPSVDKRLANSLCSTALTEAEFIASHGYQLIDLLLEQVSLCALSGRSEFLNRNWLREALKLQTSAGCFSHDSKKARPAGLRKWTDPSEICNHHLTAVVTASLAIATRVVIEVSTFE